jgi:hypothetical protein
MSPRPDPLPDRQSPWRRRPEDDLVVVMGLNSRPTEEPQSVIDLEAASPQPHNTIP